MNERLRRLSCPGAPASGSGLRARASVNACGQRTRARILQYMRGATSGEMGCLPLQGSKARRRWPLLVVRAHTHAEEDRKRAREGDVDDEEIDGDGRLSRPFWLLSHSWSE